MEAFTPGTRLHSRYVLQTRIGTGGMAQVWRGHDVLLNRPVAVKLIHLHTADVNALREAQTAARLAHQHVTAIHDYGEIRLDDRGVVAFLVMELLTGHTLADRLTAGPLAWPEARQVGLQIADALRAAHRLGIVHRDVKPANVMLTPGGVKVLDFGIAALVGGDVSDRITGTPGYAPPEVLRGAAPQPTADVYAFAAVMYEMVTGRRLWPIDTWEQAQREHARFRPPPALTGMPDVAADVIMAALDPDPMRRPTAGEIANALDDHEGDAGAGLLSTGLPSTSPPPGAPSPTLVAPTGVFIAGAARVPTTAAPVAPEADYLPLPLHRRPVALISGAVAVVLALVVVIAFLVSSPSKQNSGTTTNAAPASNTPTSAPPSVAPSSSADQSVPALLESLSEVVDSVSGSGNDGKHGRELRKDVADLMREWRPGHTHDFIEKCQDLRDEIQNRVEDEDIDPAVAGQLDTLLDQIIQAASAGGDG